MYPSWGKKSKDGGDVAGSYAFEGEIFCLVGAKK
jgi:hypothetical protein